MIPNIKIYYKFILIKWYWHKKSHINQFYITEIIQIDSYIFGQLVSTKVPK
jgi:hypothetical protein